MSIRHLLTETITTRSQTGYDGNGQPTYSTPVTHPARVFDRVKSIEDTDRRQIISMAQIVLDGDAQIAPEDQVTLPNGTRVLVIRVARHRDRYGTTTYTEVFI